MVLLWFLLICVTRYPCACHAQRSCGDLSLYWRLKRKPPIPKCWEFGIYLILNNQTDVDLICIIFKNPMKQFIRKKQFNVLMQKYEGKFELIDLFSASAYIMDLFCCSCVQKRLKITKKRIHKTRDASVLLLFLNVKAWYVFQAHIENNRTTWSHPWSSRSWIETFGKCQLIKNGGNTQRLELSCRDFFQ